jgi:hypothetical protein
MHVKLIFFDVYYNDETNKIIAMVTVLYLKKEFYWMFLINHTYNTFYNAHCTTHVVTNTGFIDIKHSR